MKQVCVFEEQENIFLVDLDFARVGVLDEVLDDGRVHFVDFDALVAGLQNISYMLCRLNIGKTSSLS